MRIFALDTSASNLSFAYKNEREIVKYEHEVKDALSVHIIELFDRFLSGHSIDFSRDVDAIMLGSGPGSFTGLRVGFIFAKMLSYIGEKPVYTLKSLYGSVFRTVLSNPGLEKKSLAVAKDAKRGELFYCIICVDQSRKYIESESFRIVREVELIEADKFEEAVDRGSHIVLTDDETLERRLRERQYKTLFLNTENNAEALIYLYKKAISVKDIFSLEPDYIRTSDAEKNLKRRLSKQ